MQLTIADARITMTADPKRYPDGRVRWISSITIPAGNFRLDGLNTPECRRGAEDSAMGDMLCFLETAAEEYDAEGEDVFMDGDACAKSFPPDVVRWAAQHSDDIAGARCIVEGDV